MIKKIILEKRRLHFHETFKIAYEEVSYDDIVFIKLVSRTGQIGFASASCDSSVNRQTADELLAFLKKKLVPSFFKWPLGQLYLYHREIQKVFKDWPMAQAGVEIALLNLWAKQNNLSLWEYFGGFRKECPLAISLGIKEVNLTIADAKKRIKEGYQIIKLKGGLSLKEDLVKIKAISQMLPKSVKLLFDANQGYTFSEAKEFIKKVKGFRLEFIEQPVKSKDWASLKRLNSLSSVPVIADEAAVTLADCQKFLLGNYVAGINVKLMKCGGPINFLKIYHLAKALNKTIIIGCMYESLASLAPAGQLALGLPVDFIDLDSGPIDFYDDPVKGGIIFNKGSLSLGGPLKL